MTEEFVVRSNRRERVLPDSLANRDAFLHSNVPGNRELEIMCVD